MSLFTRKTVAEYVGRHLHGLQVLSAPADAATYIITHSGGFHCDEALACGMLRHTPALAATAIIRTRDPALITKAEAPAAAAAAAEGGAFDNSRCVMVDVGAVYDPARSLYDHHQASFHGTMTTFDGTPRETQYRTRLSSAGLIYKHYGRDVIQHFARFLLGGGGAAAADAAADEARRAETLRLGGWDAGKTELSAEEVEVIFDKMYKNFIEEVDGVDNGVDAYGLEEATAAAGGKLRQNYLTTTGLSARVGQLHHWWNEEEGEGSQGPAALHARENAEFMGAVELASTEFFQRLAYYLLSWLPARQVVEAAFRASLTPGAEAGVEFGDGPGDLRRGDVVVFHKFCPWKDHLLDVEAEHNAAAPPDAQPVRVLFVLFEDANRPGAWRVQAVPQTLGGFANRCDLAHKGLRDAALSEASGIPGGIFVHVSGFIGGMDSYDGAVRLARQSVAASRQQQ